MHIGAAPQLYKVLLWTVLSYAERQSQSFDNQARLTRIAASTRRG